MATGIGILSLRVLTASSGTYTPTANMVNALAIIQAGGAGGESATATDEAGGGGGEGGRVIELFTAGTIGASQPYAVGQGASAATAGNSSSLGSAGALASATGGGRGGVTGSSTTLGTQAAGGASGVGSNGDLNVKGAPGQRSVQFDTTNGMGGIGGGSAGGAIGGSNVAGSNGAAYGGGGGGGQASGTPDRAGGTGNAGVIAILEFINVPDETDRKFFRDRIMRRRTRYRVASDAA